MEKIVFYVHLMVCFVISASVVKVAERTVAVRIAFGVLGIAALTIATFVSITGIINGLASGIWR